VLFDIIRYSSNLSVGFSTSRCSVPTHVGDYYITATPSRKPTAYFVLMTYY